MGGGDANERRLTILLFSAVLAPRHRLMLTSLKKAGWSVNVIAWDRTGLAEAQQGPTNAYDNWNWIRLPAPTWSRQLLFKMPRLYWQLRRELRDIPTDLLMITHIMLLPATLFTRAAAVYDAPEMYVVEMGAYGHWSAGLIRKGIALWEWFFLKLVKAVTTVDSRDGWLEKYYRRLNRRVAVIWNVPSALDRPDPATLDRAAGLYEGREVVAFIGGLMKEKGLRQALKVAALLKDRRPEILFAFIGNMKDDRSEIDRMVAEMGIEKHVLFVANLPYDQLLAHLHYARVGLALHQQTRVYSLTSAGNGRKFFTYMQAGLPVVGPEFGEGGSIIARTGAGLLVDTENEVAIAAAVNRLLSDPDEARRLGQLGRQAVEEKYNWELELERYMNFITAAAPAAGCPSTAANPPTP